jgi:mannose-6-phosphate isomerase-like protein (cupin superfamily)
LSREILLPTAGNTLIEFGTKQFTAKPESICSSGFCARSSLPDGRADYAFVPLAYSSSGFAITSTENPMANLASNHPGRRTFLRSVPAAAAALTLADTSLFASLAAAQSAPTAGPVSFQLFTADAIQSDITALQSNPGNNNLVTGKNFTVALTFETAKSAKEFEWHEGRDHVLQILSGSTVVEVGGTPKGAHSIGPGEWHAPESAGATAYTLNKGDMLIIPRNTPHKRSTAGTVALILISPQGTAA